MTKRSKKTSMIIVLIGALLFMGLGYALLSTNLNITATTGSNGEWDIQIKSITLKSRAGNAVSKSFEFEGLTASFSADLFTLGDYVEYDVVVKNEGNIAAYLADIQTQNTSGVNNVISMTNNAVQNEVLSPGASKTITVRISVDAASNIDIENAQYTLTLTYTQSDGNN